jgi:hypothetical protein
MKHSSFVLKVSCPFDVRCFGEQDVPFARQTMLTIDRALRQLVSAIEADSLQEFVEDAKRDREPAVSSNLCEALTRLYDEELRNSLDVSVAWSALSPVSQPTSEPIRIQRDYFQRIEEVRRALRDTGEPVEDIFVGTVEQLNGDMGNDGRRAGQVMLALLLPEGEEVIRANTNLNADQYEIADQAHMTDGAYVMIMGRLHPGRQPRLITNVSHFQMLATPENHLLE